MKIVIAGGSGQVGRVLTSAFCNDGHETVILSRRPMNAPWRTVQWDALTLGTWTSELEGADVLINLTGRSVDCRYHDRNRRIIKESRVNSTRVLGQAIERMQNPPQTWLQASTATIYSHRYDAPNDELTGVVGGLDAKAPDTWHFSLDVATAWEQACDEVKTPGTRKVKLRMAIAMLPDGGAFNVLLRLVRLGLGGQVGDGRQFVSWIHDRDLIRAVYWLIDHSELSGAVNLAAPHPLPHAEFMRHFRDAWGISYGMSTPEWLLEIGTFLLRTESELVLKSRRVVPTRLLESGFTFDFPTWAEAARDLCQRWRDQHDKSANRPHRTPAGTR